MFEKRWKSVPPQAFTSDGTTAGQLNIADASLFKVKQIVTVSAAGQPNLTLEIKSVENATTILVGPVGGNIKTRTDISLYTVLATAFIFANEQERSSVPEQAVERLTYEEEPTVARRVILVDKLGNKIDEDNPLPVDVEVVVPPIEVTLDAFTSPPDNAMSVGTEDGTKTGTPHVINVDDELKLRVLDVDAVTELTTANATLDDLLIQAETGGIIIGTVDGTSAGTQHVFVNNPKSQILAAHDRQQHVTYADFGTKDQRITQIDYISATFPGITARKVVTYTLVGNRYRRDDINWTLI